MPSWWTSSVPITATPAVVTGSSTPPLGMSLVLGLTCCVVILVLGVLALGIWLAARGRPSGDYEQRE